MITQHDIDPAGRKMSTNIHRFHDDGFESRDSYGIDSDWLDNSFFPVVSFLLGLLLLLLGLLGSVMAYNQAWTFPVSSYAFVLGIVSQCLLTGIQWKWRHQKRSLVYFGALAFDASLNFFGFDDLVFLWFVGHTHKIMLWLASSLDWSLMVKIPYSDYMLTPDFFVRASAYMLMYSIAILIAALPEVVLIRRRSA